MLRRLLAVLLAALLFFFGIRAAYAMSYEDIDGFHYYVRDNVNLFDQYDIGTAIPTFQSSSDNDYVVLSASGPVGSSFTNTFTATVHPENDNLNSIIVDYSDGTLYPGVTGGQSYKQLSVDIHSTSFLEKIDTSKIYLIDIEISPNIYAETGKPLTGFVEPFSGSTINIGGGSGQILAEELYSDPCLYTSSPFTTYVANSIHYRALVKFDNLSRFTFNVDGKYLDDSSVVFQYWNIRTTVNFNLYEAIDNTEESTTDWLEKIYNALTGGGDTPATDPAIDDQIAAGQSSLDQMGAVEDEIVGDFQTNVGAIAPESYSLPSQALTGISWIGSIMASVWNGLGDFQALITFPCIVALALVFIGRFSKLR